MTCWKNFAAKSGAGCAGGCRAERQLFWKLASGDGCVGGRVSARRPTDFLLLRQKKVGKEKATPRQRSRCCAAGQTCVAVLSGWAAELTSLLCSAVRTTAASQFTKRGHAALPTPPRQNHAAGAASRGVEQPYGPSLRSALVSRRVALARGGRAQRWPGTAFYPCGRAEKHSGWGERGHRRMSTPRQLIRRGCLSGTAQQQSEFCGAPRPRASQVAP